MLSKRQKIGIKLKKLRESISLTQEQLAERISYSVNTISRVETGNSGMSEKLRTALTELFGVDETYFFETNEKKIPEGNQLIINNINNDLKKLNKDSLLLIQGLTNKLIRCK